MAVSIELLTDEAIVDYSKSDGRDRVLYDYRDVNLMGNTVQVIPGGVYDADIFGSPFVDRCICGYIRQVSSQPCPYCNARVFPKEEGLRRFARIELPFYYLNNLRFDVFKTLFDDIFKDAKIILDFQSNDLKLFGYTSGRSSKKLGIKVFDTCQFDYNARKQELTISEFITDETKCSYEGLIKIIEKHFPERLTEFMKLINHYYLVQPSIMRPFTLGLKKDGEKTKRVAGTHKASRWYCMVIRLCSNNNFENSKEEIGFNDVIKKFKTPGERVRYMALLRAFLNLGTKEITSLLNTSKENLSRDLYSIRTKNSARCPIVPSTDLAIDELGIPTHIAYEMFREGFLKYLQKELNFTYKEAKKASLDEAHNPETLKLFKEYAEKQIVLVCRQPVLHEYGIFAVKVRLYDDIHVVKYPIQLCGPLGADFDGDTVSIQVVPEEDAEETYQKMSPRYVTTYHKFNTPIFVFNHETLNGLAVATEFTPEDPSELDDPRYYYNDYNELLKDVMVEKKIKIGTPITFTGQIGSVKYLNKVTCYGKIRISKILDADLDLLHILKDPKERMGAKEAAKLSTYLNGLEDGVEKRRDIQKFALIAVTIAGVVTFDYKTLYTNTNTDLYKEICDIADSKELTDQQKTALLNNKYAKYEKEVQNSFPSDLKKELDRAARVKLSSISALNMPQLIISGVDEKPIITRGSLLSGYTEKDMIIHSIENRSLQNIKQSGTPMSGYLTRQISFLLNNYVYREGDDLENPGLLIPRYKALGRTAPNGKVYPETEIARPDEEDLVPVRSIVVKKDGDINVVTPDLIGKKFKDFTDGASIGLSFATSFTENITQSTLGLKHGGHERKFDTTTVLKAPKDCTFREEGNFIYLKVRGGELKYPRPSNLVVMGNKDTFTKDEEICCAYTTTSPIFSLNALLKLMGAQTGNRGSRYYEKENINIADCYALESGVIRYEEDLKTGRMRVFIGNREYDYNPESMYYFPDGSEVRKYDRICSGVCNIKRVISELGNTKLNEIYLIFRKQVYTLIDDDFLRTGVTNLHAMQEEIIELVFTGLTDVKYDPVTTAVDEINYQGTLTSIKNKNSFYTALSFGYSADVVSKAIKGKMNISDDIMTDVVLGLLLNDKLDEGK